MRDVTGLDPVQAVISLIQDLVRATEDHALCMEAMMGAAMNSAPKIQETFQVALTPVLLQENESEVYVTFEITNDSVAASLWIGPAGVSATEGRRIPPTQTERFMLPQGAQCWGVTNAAPIAIRVSQGYTVSAEVRRMLIGR